MSIRVGDTGGPKRVGVIVATVAVVLSGALLVVAWQLFDGSAQVASLFSQDPQSAVEPAVANQAQPAEPESLELPPGMTESFALRLWQEQIDSQRMITKLVEGDVGALQIGTVSVDGDSAIARAETVLTSGETLPGTLRFRSIGDRWYLSEISAGAPDDTLPGGGSVPPLDAVDIEALNSVIAQHDSHDDLVKAVVSGEVRRIVVKDATPGPNTATIAVDIVTDASTRRGDLVVLRSESDQGAVWVIARLVESDNSAGQ